MRRGTPGAWIGDRHHRWRGGWILSGSPLQVSGPAAGLAVLVWELVRDHGLETLGPILMVAGLLQLAAGQLGSRPMVPGDVASGDSWDACRHRRPYFASQFHVMLDDKPKQSGIVNLASIPQAIVGGIFPIDGSRHELAAVIGLTTIVTLLVWTNGDPRCSNLFLAPSSQ